MSGECSVGGCDRQAVARGYCQKHYKKLKRYGNAEEPARRRTYQGEKCEVEGCDEAARSRGYCGAHYNKWRLYGDPLAKAGRAPGSAGEGELCAYEDCGKVAKARGFCPGHYIKVRYSAEREHLLPEEARAPRCLAPECNNPQYGGGLCHNHHEKYVRDGEAWAAKGDVVIEAPRTVGGRIQLERIRQGLTKRDLGERVGVSHQRVDQIEKKGLISASSVRTYADALGVSVDSLIEDTDMMDEIHARQERRQQREKNGSYKYGGRLKDRLERLEALVLKDSDGGTPS